MNGKQQTLTTKGLVITSLVAASASFGAIVAAPLSAKAQNSVVTTTSVVNIPPTVVDFTNLLLDAETSTTTTTTTTTQEGTTTTTTSETTSTTTTSSNQETTQVSTSEETSGSTTTQISTEVLESVPISTTGLEATSSVTSETTTTSTETVAVVISLSQQYALATGMDAALISELASLLGIDADLLVATLIFDRARGLQGNRQAAMEAFINALKRAGVFEIGAFDNEAFAQLFGSYATAEELVTVFNGLSEIRILFLSRASKFFASQGFRFRLARKNISFAQYFVYKYTGTRAIGFPPARGSNNRTDED